MEQARASVVALAYVDLIYVQSERYGVWSLESRWRKLRQVVAATVVCRPSVVQLLMVRMQATLLHERKVAQLQVQVWGEMALVVSSSSPGSTLQNTYMHPPQSHSLADIQPAVLRWMEWEGLEPVVGDFGPAFV